MFFFTNFRFRLFFFSPQQRSEDQISNNSENPESRQTRTREPMTRLYTVAERAPSSQSSPASDLSQALSQAVSQAEQMNQITRAAATAAAGKFPAFFLNYRFSLLNVLTRKKR